MFIEAGGPGNGSLVGVSAPIGNRLGSPSRRRNPRSSQGLIVWRLTRARFADRAFNGEGARLYGDRWNHQGVAVVYCAATLSLAALELFVHLDASEVPADLVTIAAEIPSSVAVEELDPSVLSVDWRTYPGPDSLKDLGPLGSARTGRQSSQSHPWLSLGSTTIS